MIVRNDATGQEYSLAAADLVTGATIDAGDGNDQVTIEDSVTAELAVRGGAGDDRLEAKPGTTGALTLRGGAGNDTLQGGAGDDDLEGGEGDDTMIGGAGRDALNGELGNDNLDGGDGDDQLHGGDGDDHVRGGAGDDFLMGNAGADQLDAGAGVDAIYADQEDRSIDAGVDNDLDLIVGEQGSPAASNLSGADRQIAYDAATRDAWLAAHPEFLFSGSAEAQERAKADIGVMLGTAEGRGLLTDLSNAVLARGETFTLGEKVEGPGGRYFPKTNTAIAGNWAGQYNDGTNRHPLPALFHELVHGYQDLISGFPAGKSDFNGDEAKNLERQATGLTWMDASGVVHAANELPYTDNLFRAALGLPQRSSYGGELGTPNGYLPDEGEGEHQHEH